MQDREMTQKSFTKRWMEDAQAFAEHRIPAEDRSITETGAYTI